jgi:4-hydroxymandelate oxidase
VTAGEPTIDLARVVSLHDFEPLARVAMDRTSYDYIAGGSWDELSLAASEAAWKRRILRPRVLVDVARVSTATTLLGEPASMPVAIAPMAVHGLAHPDGEVASALAAAAAGVPFILSTMSSRSLEEVAAAIPSATRRFQL